ncbi:MAG: hypothetical protein ACTHMV_07555, partial [Chitinophagaceae bacterium]
GPSGFLVLFHFPGIPYILWVNQFLPLWCSASVGGITPHKGTKNTKAFSLGEKLLCVKKLI